MTKRLLRSLFAFVITLGVAFLVNVNASAASDYNKDAALKYAKANWDSGVGLCAEYASKCLNAGGVNVSSTRVCLLYDQLLDNNYGTLYKLKLTNGKSGAIKLSDNMGKVEAGDPIFYYCNVCDVFEHVVICNGTNSNGYIQDYAHNNAHNGYKQTFTYQHCGTNNWTLYSIRMNDAETLNGPITSVPAPKINSISNLKTGVCVKWNAIEGASYYNVYRKVQGGSWAYIRTVTTNTCTDTTAQNGTTYTYTVRAYKDKTFSPFYNGETIKYLSNVAFKYATNTKDGINVTWNANPAATGYYLYRQVNDDKWAFYKSVYGANTTGYADKDVVSGNTYRYRIKAVSGSVVSDCDFYGVETKFLSTPKLGNTLNIIGGIIIHWDDVVGADGYFVYRKAAGEKSWKYVGVAADSLYVDKTVTSGVFYSYTVRAYSGRIFSGFDANGVSLQYLVTPELKSATNTSNGITLQWTAQAGAQNYYVYRKVEGTSAWQLIANVKGATATIYTDTNVQNGVTYVYTVRAINGYRMSSFYPNGIKSKFECSSN